MAVTTTGSTVEGLVPGLNTHFIGCRVMGVLGDPNGIVNPVVPTSDPSGCIVAYDTANNQLYQNTTGSTWTKLGSVA